jgi:four helix bundle protein
MKMRISQFEDLECWREARVLTRIVYSFTKRTEFSKDYRLNGQITGAAISIMNNICEGFDSKSNNEFVRFLTYSRRSCSEVQNCLYVALDQTYIAKDEFQNTYTLCTKVRKIIDGLIRYLKDAGNRSLPDRPKRANGRTGKPANR